MSQASSLRRSFGLIALACALGAGCGDSTTPGDAGEGSFDAAAVDARASEDDASTIDDASASDDASTIDDASASDDASTIDDASTPSDAATSDACVAPRCPPIPVGCDVSGGTACTCGTITCPPEPCSPACGRREYCMYESTCGGTGACVATPEACPRIIDPVCGCDGRTYSNSCVAAQAGQSVASEGECGAEADCRTEGCAEGSSCQACRGIGGASYVCLPDGAVC